MYINFDYICKYMYYKLYCKYIILLFCLKKFNISIN